MDHEVRHVGPEHQFDHRRNVKETEHGIEGNEGNDGSRQESNQRQNRLRDQAHQPPRRAGEQQR